MARRSDPQRLHEAKAAATVESLVSAGIARKDAGAWVAAWECEARARELAREHHDYWPTGESWIAMRRSINRKSPD